MAVLAEVQVLAQDGRAPTYDDIILSWEFVVSIMVENEEMVAHVLL